MSFPLTETGEMLENQTNIVDNGYNAILKWRNPCL